MSGILLKKNLLDTQFSGIADVINKANKLGEDVIRLEVGDVDLDSSQIVVQGLLEAISEKKTHYPALRGDSDLIDEIVFSLKNENINVTRDQILITSGGSMGMYLAMQSIINQGDEVIIFEPIWPHLTQMILLASGTPVAVALDASTGFHLNVRNIENYITKKTKAIILNTPNNPTGVIYDETEISQLCQLAEKHNLVVISDEEYCNFFYRDNQVVSPINYYGNTIISRSFSKTYSVSGLRLGYIIAPAEWISAITKWSLFSTMYSPSITQYAILKALQQRDVFPDQGRKIFEKRMNFVVEKINEIDGLSCEIPEGSVYVWLDFTAISLDDQAICEKLLYDAKVAIVPGSCFGTAGIGYARLSLGQDISLLDEAIKRIRNTLRK